MKRLLLFCLLLIPAALMGQNVWGLNGVLHSDISAETRQIKMLDSTTNQLIFCLFDSTKNRGLLWIERSVSFKNRSMILVARDSGGRSSATGISLQARDSSNAVQLAELDVLANGDIRFGRSAGNYGKFDSLGLHLRSSIGYIWADSNYAYFVRWNGQKDTLNKAGSYSGGGGGSAGWARDSIALTVRNLYAGDRVFVITAYGDTTSFSSYTDQFNVIGKETVTGDLTVFGKITTKSVFIFHSNGSGTDGQLSANVTTSPKWSLPDSSGTLALLSNVVAMKKQQIIDTLNHAYIGSITLTSAYVFSGGISNTTISGTSVFTGSGGINLTGGNIKAQTAGTFLDVGYSGTFHVNDAGQVTMGVWNGTALTSTYVVSLPWSKITTTPTTRNGYGITDVPLTDGTSATGTWSINVTGSSSYATSAGSAGYATSAGSATNAGYATTAGSASANDVYAWAKASTKPSYTASEVGLGNVTNNAQWYSGNHPTTVSGYGITDMSSQSVSYAATAGAATTASTATTAGDLTGVLGYTHGGTGSSTLGNAGKFIVSAGTYMYAGSYGAADFTLQNLYGLTDVPTSRSNLGLGGGATGTIDLTICSTINVTNGIITGWH